MKKRIAIVCGGDSSEHDVSMRSGAGLYSFFDKERYDVKIVEMRGLDWQVHLDGEKRTPVDLNDFSYQSEGKKEHFDYIYITVHGAPGENGVLQGYFELLHIPYSTSGVLVEALTFDKFALNNHLRSFGINVADSILIRKDGKRPSDAELIERFGLPFFVKPAADGSSFGVSKVKSANDIDKALQLAFSESDEVMVESFLDGTEISQGVYKTKDKSVVLPATEVVTSNEFFDYDAKYNGQVQEITPARLDPATAEKVAAETSRIYDILHANGIIRVDYIISKNADGSDKVNMLEINTTPGMTATSFIPQQVRAAGMDIKKVLSEIVENQIGE
jgi:D-alanine-D-alanine ligase